MKLFIMKWQNLSVAIAKDVLLETVELLLIIKNIYNYQRPYLI